MNIDRKELQGNTAKERITFCLNRLEKARTFKNGIDWNTEIVVRLTIEEMIGALVSAEQELE